MLVIGFLKILAAAIVPVLIGFVWFHPRVFGSVWLRHSRMMPEMIERGKRRTHIYALAGFIASVVVAYVLNYFHAAIGVASTAHAIALASLVWLGFIAPSLSGMILWEQKPFSYYAVNAAYWLLSLVSMSLVLIWL